MKSLKKAILSVVVFVFVLIAIGMTTYTVKPNEAAIILKLGKIDSVVSEPGLHFIVPFIKSVDKVYVGTIRSDIPSSDVITSDKKSMIADNYVLWSVIDPAKYYQTLGATKERAEERIEAAVYNATKNTISARSQDEIIAARGDMLTQLITDAANSDIQDYGICINLAEIKALDLPDDNKNAVYERMISERNNIASSYSAKGNAEAQKIKNDTNKQVSILIANAEREAAKIQAEGEAEYMRILSDAYNDEGKAELYNYMRGLSSMKAIAKEGNTIILDKNSEYARILYGNP